MTSTPPTECEQHLLKIPSKLWILIGVVMGIALLGDWEYRVNAPKEANAGYAFGGWRAPIIEPISMNSTIELSSEFEMDHLEGFRFYRARFPGDRGVGAIAFVNTDASIVGSITVGDSRLDTWPPERKAFLREPTIAGITLFDAVSLLPPLKLVSEDDSLLARSIDYREIHCDWVTPRKASNWPARTHIGRFTTDDGSQTMVIRLQEFSADQSPPNYESGAIGRLGNSLRRR